MKTYLKLVNFEFNRCAKLYAVLIGMTVVSQLIAVFAASRRYISQLKEKNMIILIGGSTHTGKTVLSQNLIEKYHYPSMSLDHLKM